KPISKQLVKMLDESFHYNNTHLHLIAAYHKIPTPTLEYIPIKVRQNLIQEFQSLNKKNPIKDDIVGIDASTIENDSKQKKVFISYAWEDEEHNSKIISFVEFLRNNGFDAS